MNIFATLGISLAPLLLTTQAQATNVAVSITSAQNITYTPSFRTRGMNPDVALRLKGDVSGHLRQLFVIRDKLEKGIARLQFALDSGEPVLLSSALVSAALAGISSGEAAIEMTEDSFSRILSADRVACRPALEALKAETLTGLFATIETMKKIPELAKQTAEREKAVISFDKNRMSLALKSDKIEMIPGMSREEKRRFILSHAS